MDVATLMDQAIKLGMDSDTAQGFIDLQLRNHQERVLKNQEREDRLFEREERRKKEEKAEEEKRKKEEERSKKEERAYEMELFEREEKRKKEEREHEMELVKLKLSAGDSGIFSEDKRMVKSLPKIPPFNEDIDEVDLYIQRFEKLAVFHKWEKTEYATLLGTLLRGKALKVYCGLAPSVADNYEELKSALLKAFQVNPNNYRKKFRESTIEQGESYVQLICRMRQYYDKWLELSEVLSTYEQVSDYMIFDQVLSNCSSELRAYLLEKKFSSSHEMALCADRYMAAHGITKCKRTKVPTKSSGIKPLSKTKTSEPLNKSELNPYRNVRCHLCNQMGHIRPQCPDNPNNYKTGKSKEKFNVPEIKFAMACEEKPPNSIVDNKCKIFGEQAEAVFDTGCNAIVVRKDLIPKHYKLGKKTKVYNFMGVPVYLPRVKCYIQSKFFSGKVNAIVAPIRCTDVLIGLIPGLKENVMKGLNLIEMGDENKRSNNDIVINAVTRAQQVKQNKPIMPLTCMMQDLEINPTEFSNSQWSCSSLSKIRQILDSNEEITCKGRTIKFVNVDNVIYRKCIQSKDVSETGRMQLVVPLKYRQTIMKVAHESLLAGHFSSRKTVDKILHKFFWEKAGAEITRFCKSCHSCQKFGPKAKKVPLVKMPIISEPFSRIAIDIVGPITPASDRGHKYIFTVIDLATRYPEAVPLKNIDTVTIAESLVEVFSRVGVPKEILSDRGTQFKADLMSEVHRLLSIRALYTSPYHAACNGMVERLNGVLKNMLKKVCMDNPTDWDRYIPVVLFAYREIPNDSLKFSPFELLYGRNVRGPLSILHELLSNDNIEDNVKTTYQYVIDLRSKLQETAKIAVDNASISSRKYKEYFDRKTKPRKFVKGDEVLVMLPTSSNKFLMQWKGPYVVDSCHGNGVDYIIKVGNRLKLYHANMLKRYYRRVNVNTIQKSVQEAKSSHKLLCNVQVNVVDVSDSVTESELGGIEFYETTDTEYQINPNITVSQKLELIKLLSVFKDVIRDKPGVTNTLSHDIRLTSKIPIRSKSYPVPVNLIATFNEEIDKMLAMDIIEPSVSPYCSPVILIKKVDGSWRLCIDFRDLNDITIFDAEPMPTITESLHEFNNKVYFTELDLCKGYWQIPMVSEVKECTAFATKYGLMQFKRMPFGLKTACATFVRLMRIVLSGLSNTACYFDNIVIHSSNWKDHLIHVRAVLIRLREHGLTVGPNKCFFAFNRIKYLGYCLGNNTLSPLENRVVAIINLPLPATKKQLRSFMGTVQFYSRFIHEYSIKAAPITDLLKKGSSNSLSWSENQIKSFNELKCCLSKQPILVLPNFEKQFFLRTDASNEGVGAILLQENEGTLKPTCYGSKKFSDTEKRYSTIEKECYAIIWAVQKFKEYLYGKEFILQTDHLPLAYLHKMKNKNDRLMRWTLSLQPYSFLVEYIKGSDNIGSDMLSRC